MDGCFKVALGARLRGCSGVKTLGVRCNWDDYTPYQQSLILSAKRIYFPTIFYAGSLHAAGKSIFPSFSSYHHLGDKLRQLTLFSVAGIPHPRTRIFYGRRESRASAILKEFSFPFVAKVPRGSGRGQGVYLIQCMDELNGYLDIANPAYIQEHIPMKRDLRVVIVGRRAVHAYWKEAVPENFRTNVAQGGRISLSGIPQDALEFALEVAQKTGIDYAGLDLCKHDGRWLVLEANMNFGEEGFVAAGIDIRKILCQMVSQDEI